jgi:Ras-related protein Rab-11A
MLFLVGNKCDLEYLREVSTESVLEFKELHGILYFCESSAKSGKNVESLFTDCAKFMYSKFRERMDNAGNDGDLSSDNDSSFDNSIDGTEKQGGSFKESKGHKAGRRKSRRKLRTKGGKK